MDNLEDDRGQYIAFLALPDHRTDVISYMVAGSDADPSHHMSREELEINSMLLVVAGSESVTTALVGAIH